jgi:hypothetical protein
MMKHPEFDQMVALAERLRLELDSSDRKNLVGSQIIPDKFYKRGSQEKTLLQRLEFFLLLSPLDRARSILTYRAMCSVAGQCDPAVWVFSTSGFHRFFATKPVSSETNKAERGQIWRP